MKQASRSAYLWMLLGSLSFSVMGALTHALGESCDWRLIALIRSSLAALFASGLAVSGGARFVLFRPPVLWVRSLAGSLSLVGTFYALTRLPISQVLTLTNMFPLWVACLSWPLLRERPSVGTWTAIACGLVGVALVQRPHFAEGNTASIIALAASVSTAVAMLGLHRLQGLDPRAIVVHFSVVSAIICLAVLLLAEPAADFAPLTDPVLLFMLLGVGISATIGQLLLTLAFAAGPPARVSVVALTQVIFAFGFDLVLWKEHFELPVLLGMVLIVLPTAWILLRRREPRAMVAELPGAGSV